MLSYLKIYSWKLSACPEFRSSFVHQETNAGLGVSVVNRYKHTRRVLYAVFGLHYGADRDQKPISKPTLLTLKPPFGESRLK